MRRINVLTIINKTNTSKLIHFLNRFSFSKIIFIRYIARFCIAKLIGQHPSLISTKILDMLTDSLGESSEFIAETGLNALSLVNEYYQEL